jgi:hypothetical protein
MSGIPVPTKQAPSPQRRRDAETSAEKTKARSMEVPGLSPFLHLRVEFFHKMRSLRLPLRLCASALNPHLSHSETPDEYPNPQR